MFSIATLLHKRFKEKYELEKKPIIFYVDEIYLLTEVAEFSK